MTDTRTAHTLTPMTLAEQTTRRLLEAGVTEDDPALKTIREWNAAAYARAAAKEAEGRP